MTSIHIYIFFCISVHFTKNCKNKGDVNIKGFTVSCSKTQTARQT